MSYVHYDRLSALDASFLALEDASVHMHVGAVGIFEAGPVSRPGGGLDLERIRSFAEPALRQNQRFRQRLERIPLFEHPVWVDDPRFNLDYHLRHTSLPEPGDARQLKRLAGRILSQKLDRGKPLWELWFVEGLEGDRFALISKIHHCMIDGISGADLLAAFMRLEPESGEGAVPLRWLPRPAPSRGRLLADELRRRASLPGRILGAGLDGLRRPAEASESATHALGSLGEALGAALGSASPTPLNDPIGPYRRFDWTRFDLDAVKEVKKRLGGTVNDVVLATVTGAVRGFLEQRGVRTGELDFRALLPVSIRSDSQRGSLGNRVAFLLARLPLDEGDPRRRLERVVETTQKLKSSGEVRGGELLERVSEWTIVNLIALASKLASRTRSFNMVVTNVPGPQQPVYLLEARMLELYPLVPLYRNQALGIALFSYDGGLYWGFNADWEAVPDLHDVVEAVQVEFETLRKL
jgi:diacylglycerol O-acyltransferase